MLKNKQFLRKIILCLVFVFSISIALNNVEISAKTIVTNSYDSKNRVIEQKYVDNKNTSSTKDDKVLYTYKFYYNSNNTIKYATKVKGNKVVSQYYYKKGTKFGSHSKRISYYFDFYYNKNNTLKLAKKIQKGLVLNEYYYKSGTRYGNHSKRISYQLNFYYYKNKSIKYVKKIINKKTVAIYYYSSKTKYSNHSKRLAYINYYNSKGKLTKTVYKTKAAKQAALVNYAKKLKGSKYRSGGTSPKGFDCSGLTSYVYKKVLNKNIGRATYNQTKKGSYVSLKKLQPGDLVFWGAKKSPYHVGIYLGNGKYIHAEDYGKGVNIKTFNYFKPSYAKRMI
ncbi:MAG: C40 family peptidase [Bacilli bacterium]|jgi:cell wall-associated NlpC family hydrolase|nr:C40 family peptidase [Bacilli bacterium]